MSTNFATLLQHLRSCPPFRDDPLLRDVDAVALSGTDDALKDAQDAVTKSKEALHAAEKRRRVLEKERADSARSLTTARAELEAAFRKVHELETEGDRTEQAVDQHKQEIHNAEKQLFEAERAARRLQQAATKGRQQQEAVMVQVIERHVGSDLGGGSHQSSHPASDSRGTPGDDREVQQLREQLQRETELKEDAQRAELAARRQRLDDGGGRVSQLERVVDQLEGRARDDQNTIAALTAAEANARDDAARLQRDVDELRQHVLAANQPLTPQVIVPVGPSPPRTTPREVLLSGGGSSQGYPMIGVELNRALRVVGVRPGGPGAQASLMEGDVFMSINGTPVFTREDFHSAVRQCRVGDRVAFSLRRGGPDPDRVEIHTGMLNLVPHGVPGGPPSPPGTQMAGPSSAYRPFSENVGSGGGGSPPPNVGYRPPAAGSQWYPGGGSDGPRAEPPIMSPLLQLQDPHAPAHHRAPPHPPLGFDNRSPRSAPSPVSAADYASSFDPDTTMMTGDTGTEGGQYATWTAPPPTSWSAVQRYPDDGTNPAGPPVFQRAGRGPPGGGGWAQPGFGHHRGSDSDLLDPAAASATFFSARRPRDM